MPSRILRAVEAFLNPPAPPPLNLIPATRAEVCVEPTCESVFDAGESARCPACGSESTSLVAVMKRVPAPVLEFRRQLARRARVSFLRELDRKRSVAR